MMRSLLLILLAACTDFTDVPRDVCGNGLLEAGEDCDRDDASCVRCAVTCSMPADCPNASYTCGVDGFCHAPGGLFGEPTAPLTFGADDLEITDIDRDGIGDVVGVSKTSIIVRHGDATGSLVTAQSFVTPAQSGPHAFGDLDGDGANDVTLSTLDGIVTYSSRFGTLSPVAIESPLVDNQGNGLDIRRLLSVGTFQLGAFVVGGNQMFLIVVDLLRPENQGFFVEEPCRARLGALQPSQVDLASVDLYRTANDELLVSFTTTSGQPCVVSVRGQPLVDFTFADITPAGVGTVTRRPVLADVDADGDPCPTLVNSTAGAGALRGWDGVLANGRCTLRIGGAQGLALSQMPQAPMDAVAVGRIPIDPPIAGLSPDAIVMTSGVYAHVGSFNAFGEMYGSSERKLAYVASGDLDRDGDLDAVLAGDGDDDLDILFRFPNGLQLFRVDTASAVTSLTIGDYDGNGVNDVAYTEINTDHTAMMISYGTADRPLDPIQVAAFSGVSSVTPLEFPDSVDTLNIATDLAVIHVGDDVASSTLSLLHGSPQRTMLSFFDPRSENENSRNFREDTILRGTVIGDFTDSPAARHRDLVAIGSPRQGVALPMQGWRVAGLDSGLDGVASPAVVANGFSDCNGNGVCVGNAKYLAWPTTPGRDLIIAVDRQQPAKASVIDPRATTAAFGKLDIPQLLAKVPADALVHSLYAIDLEGDGTRELLASFAGPSSGAALVCTMSSVGVPSDCQDLTDLVKVAEPQVVACSDAAPGRVGARDPTSAPTAGIDLVALCHGAEGSALFRISRDTGTLAASRIAIANTVRSLRVADVTGDGVDDVIAVQGAGGTQAVTVFAQCSSREAPTCRTAAGESP